MEQLLGSGQRKGVKHNTAYVIINDALSDNRDTADQFGRPCPNRSELSFAAGASHVQKRAATKWVTRF